MQPHRTPYQRPTDGNGFTLVEIVITLLILGAVAGLLLPFFNAIIHSPDPVMRERAISLGQAMMDEILAKKWDENTPIGGGPLITVETPAANGTTCIPCNGNRLYCFVCRHPGYTPAMASAILGNDTEDRADYDDVDDYHGSSEVDNFTDQAGAGFVMTGYSRQVAVRYIASTTDPIDQNSTAAPGTTDTKLVVVTISSPRGETFNFVAVACNI